MMTMALPVPTERLIYSLTDYTCDGTASTFIDTGIKLFGLEYNAFRIEMEYDGLDITTTNLETLLECKAFSSGTITNGLTVKVGNNTQPQYSDAIAANIYPCTENYFFKNTSSATVIITYGSNSGSVNVNGDIKTGSGTIVHNEPLTIGGRYSSHLSNPDRFVQVHISSLKIYATPSGIDTSYIYLPLTFKCLTGGDLSIKNANGSYDRNFEYSLNGGAWTAFDLPKNTASKLIATLSPNDTISFRRDNDNFADAQFLSDSNLTFDIYGNLLSLQYGSAFDGQTELKNTAKKAFGAIFSGTNVVDASKLMLTAPTLSQDCYNKMFMHCTSLVSAPTIFATNSGNNSLNGMFSECYNLVNVQSQLYITTLATGCCREMFNDCQSLVNAPALPATTLAEGCYYTMFRNCYSLITAPELPATTMEKNCYYGMFSGCTGLINAPELSAITLAEGCYCAMFKGCTSLTAAPELPATVLKKECYSEMFFGCTSLTTAPELPATTLVQQCYNSLFKNCSRLNYIKCLATDGFSTSFCLSGWVAGISSTGTFIKASGVTWPSGNNGIPSGWTVIEE